MVKLIGNLEKQLNIHKIEWSMKIIHISYKLMEILLRLNQLKIFMSSRAFFKRKIGK